MTERRHRPGINIPNRCTESEHLESERRLKTSLVEKTKRERGGVNQIINVMMFLCGKGEDLLIKLKGTERTHGSFLPGESHVFNLPGAFMAPKVQQKKINK